MGGGRWNISNLILHTVLNCFGLSCNSNKQHMYITIVNKSCYNNSQTKLMSIVMSSVCLDGAMQEDLAIEIYD